MSGGASTLAAGASVHRLGEDTLLLRLGDRVDPVLNARVHALATRLRRAPPAWLRELAPAYASLALTLDPDAFPGDGGLVRATQWLREQLEDVGDAAPTGLAREVAIEVRYGGEHGPDLEAVAAHCGLDAAEVVRRHTAASYRVAMLGFAPGFPYLLGLDPALTTPRLARPRTRVEAGSIAIGGGQTGIYPRPGPGGWRVIGRTDAVLFDADRDPPSLLRAGDRVRFMPLRAAR